MNGAHWSGQDSIDHLYGIGPDAAHLDVCGECRAHVEALEAARKESARAPEVSSEFLAAQRRSIYRKLGREPRPRLRFAPTFAVALLVMVALLVGLGEAPEELAPVVARLLGRELVALLELAGHDGRQDLAVDPIDEAGAGAGAHRGAQPRVRAVLCHRHAHGSRHGGAHAGEPGPLPGFR